jgi:hypothetical protein
VRVSLASQFSPAALSWLDKRVLVGIYTDIMPRVKKQTMTNKGRQTARVLQRYDRQYQELKEALGALGYFCKGTVLSRTLKCGRATCPCAKDPAQRHGPYFEWTYKVAGKTQYHRLSPQAGEIYSTASAEYRKLKSLLRRLELLSRRALVEMTKPPPSA